LGLPYEAYTIHIGKNEQFAPEFLAVSPNNKIPAIVDPRVPVKIHFSQKEHNAVQVEGFHSAPQSLHKTADGWETTLFLAPATYDFKFIVDGSPKVDSSQAHGTNKEGQQVNHVTVKGEPLKLFESGAILLHLAETTGKLIPQEYYARKDTITWLFWQMAGLGPMFGQYGHFFKYAKEKIPYAIQRYETEAKRLLGVLQKQLGDHQFVIGNEYTIADIAIWPWVHCLEVGYGNLEILKEFPVVEAWKDRCKARPASQKGLVVTPFS